LFFKNIEPAQGGCRWRSSADAGALHQYPFRARLSDEKVKKNIPGGFAEKIFAIEKVAATASIIVRPARYL